MAGLYQSNAMSDYNLQSLYGFRFTAKQTLNKYSDTGRNLIGTVKSGEMVGTLYSYVQRNNDLWLMFYDTYKNPFYVKYIPYSIDAKDLKQQGALTALQELEKQREKEMGAFELFMHKYFFKIMTAFVILIAVAGLSKNPQLLKKVRYAK